MSSPQKDARWLLATALAEAAGFDSVNDLPFAVTEHLLSTANFVLLQLPQEKVEELAARWNNTEPPEPELEWGIKNIFTNRVGFPFPEAQAHSIVAGTYNSEDGSNMFVVVKRRPATEWEIA